MLRKVEFIGTPQPTPWICDGVVARGCLTLLAGEAGQGKSWLALGLAKGVAEGRSVAGIPCRMGTALYVDAENGYAELFRRKDALRLNGECKVYLSEGFNLEENLPALAHIVAVERPDLLVLDGLRSLWIGGDENDSGRVTALLSPLRTLLREYEAGGLLLHHLNKLGGYRGSTALMAEPEIGIHMYRKDGTNERFLKWQKCRVGTMPNGSHKFRIVNGPTGTVELDGMDHE